MKMPRSTLCAAAVVACAVAALLPAHAPAAWSGDRLSLFAPHAGHAPSRVFARQPTANAQLTSATSPVAYSTAAGETVDVTFAAGLTPDAAVAQSYVDFLGTLPHGSELSKLRVLLATPQDIRRLCGGRDGTLACYSASTRTMTVPGEQLDPSSGVTTNYVVAHEYGHHIAAYRNNAPFQTLDYGPKYWSSYHLVCSRALEKKLFPGNEGNDYLRNPGEAWADTYAHLAFPNVRWQYSALLTPSPTAYALARKDVLTPWKKPKKRIFRGEFTPTSSNARRFSFTLTLDGAMSVRLKGPKETNYDLALLSGGKVEDRSRQPGSSDRISYADGACRQRRAETITVSVSRRHGSGPFSVRVSYAG